MNIPQPDGKRVSELDVLRGFAMLGVYIVKMSMLFFLAIATCLIAALLCLLMQRRFQSGVLELLMKRLAYGRG